jgi:ribonuclease R
VRLDDTGADGLVPVSSLGDEYFLHDDRTHALIGERTGRRFPLGLAVTVRLIEAVPITGGLLFELMSEPLPADPNAPRPRLGVRQRAGAGRPQGRPQKPGGGRRRR